MQPESEEATPRLLSSPCGPKVKRRLTGCYALASFLSYLTVSMKNVGTGTHTAQKLDGTSYADRLAPQGKLPLHRPTRSSRFITLSTYTSCSMRSV